MATCEDIKRLLSELTAYELRSRELFEQLQADEAADAPIDEQLISETESVSRGFEVKLRELRSIPPGMSREDWEEFLAECREGCPETLTKFVDWLGLPQSTAG